MESGYRYRYPFYVENNAVAVMAETSYGMVLLVMVALLQYVAAVVVSRDGSFWQFFGALVTFLASMGNSSMS